MGLINVRQASLECRDSSAPSALALSSWSCWKVGTLSTSGSADGLRQWTLLTLAKF